MARLQRWEVVKKLRNAKHGQVFCAWPVLGDQAPTILVCGFGTDRRYIVGKRKDCISSAMGEGDGDGAWWTKSPTDAHDRRERLAEALAPEVLKIFTADWEEYPIDEPAD